MKKHGILILLTIIALTACVSVLPQGYSNAAVSVSAATVSIETGILGKTKSTLEIAPTYDGEEVYLGGFPLGIELRGEGLTVRSINAVITEGGAVTPLEGSDIAIGDIIVSVDGRQVQGIRDLQLAVERSVGEIELTVKRGETISRHRVKPVIDSLSRKKRLGIELENPTAGIGTMTFIGKNGIFASLGHRIADNGAEQNGGLIFPAHINGVKPGERGTAGALQGTFLPLAPLGAIRANSVYGVYGDWLSREPKSTIKIGGRATITVGKAHIYTTISGVKPELYEVEIIKLAEQNTPAEKSMLISVTDRRLLSLTGGIVQGMSGSPLIQNKRLVGAVTHVLTGDPSKGFALYADWMMEYGNMLAS